MVQEDSDRGGGDLCDAGDLLDVLHHVTDNVLCTQDLKWARKLDFSTFILLRVTWTYLKVIFLFYLLTGTS